MQLESLGCESLVIVLLHRNITSVLQRFDGSVAGLERKPPGEGLRPTSGETLMHEPLIDGGTIRKHSEPSTLTDAVIHGFFVDGAMHGAAELRPLGSGGEAEAAFSIETAWQSHGVGTALLERTLLAARNRQIKLLHMTCLAENQHMQQLALKFDAELTFDFGSVVGEVEAPHPTPMSMMREFVADSTGLATAMLDVQSRLLRPA